MPNPQPARPHVARLAKRKKNKPGNMHDLGEKLWAALQTAEDLLREDDPALKLKAIHALSQVAGTYARVYEVGELEARLAALEAAQVDERRQGAA